MSQMSPDFEVRLPAEWDISGLLTINYLSHPGVAALDRAGFARLIQFGATVLAAESTRMLCGYVIAFDRGHAYDGEEFEYFCQHLPENFVYVDQVETHPREFRRGVATMLYKALFALESRRQINTF